MKHLFIIIKLSLSAAKLLIIAILITKSSIFKRKTIVVDFVSNIFDEINYKKHWLKRILKWVKFFKSEIIVIINYR